MDIFTIIAGIASILAIPTSVLYARREKKKNRILDAELKKINAINQQQNMDLNSLRENIQNYKPISSLPVIAREIISCASNAKVSLCIALPFPLLFSFFYQNNFGYDNYKESDWYKMFCHPLLNALKRDGSKLRFNYLRLNDNRSLYYAKAIFKNITKAKDYMKVLKEFEKELEIITDFYPVEVFDMPHWMLIKDYAQDNNQEAAVAFTKPELVLDAINKGNTPEDVGSLVKGIITYEHQAIEYFHKIYAELIQKGYFVEVFAEIESKIENYKDGKIDIAFIHKYNKHFKDGIPPTLRPTEVIIRKPKVKRP